MTLELVANEDMLVEFTAVAVPPDAVYTGDPGIDLVEIVPTLSTKCKANAKKIGTTGIAITFTPAGCPFTSTTYTFVGASGSVSPLATKTKAEGALVLREGDTGTCVGTPVAGGWTLTASPFTALPCSCTVAISDAGQTKVKAQ